MIAQLMDRVLPFILWAVNGSARSRRSKTGYQNPRTRHLTNRNYLPTYVSHALLPNTQKWLQNRTDLFPAAVEVQTINRCNGRCISCPYPYTIRKERAGIMDDEVYSRIVDECTQEQGLKFFIPMSKNEPLLDSKLEERVAEFREKSSPHQIVEIITNGELLTLARYRLLSESGVDLISISLNAGTEETHRRIMAGVNWEKVIQNLDDIATEGSPHTNIFIQFLKQQSNIAEYKAFLRYWRRRGFNTFSFEMNNRSGTVKEYTSQVPSKRHLWHHFGMSIGRALSRLCPFAFSIAHVLHNGDVPLCCNDWYNREILGNIHHSSLRKIYNSGRIQEVRRLMYQGRYSEIDVCRDCSIWREWAIW